MQHTFTGTALTSTVEAMIGRLTLAAAVQSAEHNAKYDMGYDDAGTPDRTFTVYCLLRDTYRGVRPKGVTDAMLAEVSRLYPSEADDARISAYEYANDI